MSCWLVVTCGEHFTTTWENKQAMDETEYKTDMDWKRSFSGESYKVCNILHFSQVETLKITKPKLITFFKNQCDSKYS